MFKMLFKFKRIRANTLLRQRKFIFSDYNLVINSMGLLKYLKKILGLNAVSSKASVRFLSLCVYS